MSEAVHLDDIAAALLMRIIAQSPESELVGAVLPNGTYQLGDSIVSGKRHVTGMVPGNSIATAHNHPGGNPDFSADDVENADQIQRTAYLGAGQNPALAELRRYDPGFTETYRGQDGKKRSHGEAVLAQFPMDEFRAYLMRKLLDRAADDPRGLMR